MALKDAALHALIEPVVTAMGFELWGIDYLSQGKHSRLVIYIDHAEGVTRALCADISRQVSLARRRGFHGRINTPVEASSPIRDRPSLTTSSLKPGNTRCPCA
ncbi:hypothetical protein DSL92_02340 [Billgrantia gudaonensis]|uniref:Ribosome maturation factor RimP N-terminal domain-containing protein n=1 Tax=Billgrantia gudaonensis TaxID=376427 RepID=A0A432JK63_9GAMM|nr:hypothetical protein DSL92_02340 [Halomonas gudaonensis]